MLTPSQLSFVELYIAGPPETVGNATASYLEAFPRCQSRGAAGVSANRLLATAKVRARILELRADAERTARARLRSWWLLAPAAQDTLEAAAAGTFDPAPLAPHGVRAELIRSGVRAAQEILSRAEGTPQQLHELRLEAGITVLIGGPHRTGSNGGTGGSGRELLLGDDHEWLPQVGELELASDTGRLELERTATEGGVPPGEIGAGQDPPHPTDAEGQGGG